MNRVSEEDPEGNELSATDPSTVEEWAGYISKLTGEALRSKGIAANTLPFIITLQEEGYGPQEITDIMVLWAMQFAATDQAPPDGMPGQYLSYPDLLDSIGR
jgi:hypothetical protein